MQPQVEGCRCEFKRNIKTRIIDTAKGKLRFFECTINRVVPPRAMPELNYILRVMRYVGYDCRQPLFAVVKITGQLKQEMPEFVAEPLQDKILEAENGIAVLHTLNMRDVAAHLHRK